MPDLEKIGELVTKLATLTRDNKVKWSETADDSTFNSSLPQFQVSIAKKFVRENWGQDVYDYFVTFRDQSGRVLDEASDTDFNAVPIGGRPALEALRDLHDLARRNALGVDRALSELLASLNNI